MTSDLNSLHDRARTTALSDAAQALRDNSRTPPNTVADAAEGNPESGRGRGSRTPVPKPDTGPDNPPGAGPPRSRRHRSRRNSDPAGSVAEEALALLADATQDLTDARREIERLRADLDDTNTRLLEETRESALMRRQRDGLQHRTDYLEEKLDLVTRALTRAARPWWRRARGG